MATSALIGCLFACGVAAGVALLSWHRHHDPDISRRARIGRLASRMGWSFAPDDVFDHEAMSFAVLRDFPTGRAANVLVGESYDGKGTCVFDYVVPTPATERGNTRFTCVVTDLSQAMPGLIVVPRVATGRLADPRHLVDDRTGDQVFDDRFWLGAHDDAFAQRFLDATMRRWLVDRWPVAGFEVAGPLLLTWGPALVPRRIRDAVSAADELHARIPPSAGAYAIEHATGSGGEAR